MTRRISEMTDAERTAFRDEYIQGIFRRFGWPRDRAEKAADEAMEHFWNAEYLEAVERGEAE